MSVWKWQVSEPHGRADRAILEALEAGRGSWEGEPVSVSRSRLKRLIEESFVRADAGPVKAGSPLKVGATVKIEFPAPVPLALTPEDRPIDILYQDEHLLVVNKPPGLTVHPSSTQREGTLVHALLHHVKDLSGIGGALRPGIVHRIDKDTSGLLVITKTDVAHRRLVEVFAAHAIERNYWALCYGTPPSRLGHIEGAIGRNPADRKKMAILARGGRKATTHYERIEEYGIPTAKPFASLIELRLETGRTHQIRVHLTARGNSLLGDPTYGTPSARQGKWTQLPEEVKRRVEALPGQALHARTLGFEHPVSGKSLHFEAPPPPGFASLLEQLRKYA